MSNVKLVLSMIHNFFAGILGLTIIDLAAIVDFGFLENIDDSIKTVFIVLGLVFYVLAIPHRLTMQKYKRREKQLDIQQKEHDLSIDMEKQDLDKLKRDIGFKEPKKIENMNITSPTEIIILRGKDPTGHGHFGAKRGERIHNGTDYVAQPNENIYACISGIVRIGNVYKSTKKGKPKMKLVEIKNSQDKVKQMYVSCLLETGDKIAEGDLIGFSQDISDYHHKENQPKMINHCHVSVWRNGKLIDPETVIV